MSISTDALGASLEFDVKNQCRDQSNRNSVEIAFEVGHRALQGPNVREGLEGHRPSAARAREAGVKRRDGVREARPGIGEIDLVRVGSGGGLSDTQRAVQAWKTAISAGLLP
jgi:hypothetical protein